jgi:hypothetical protein
VPLGSRPVSIQIPLGRLNKTFLIENAVLIGTNRFSLWNYVYQGVYFCNREIWRRPLELNQVKRSCNPFPYHLGRPPSYADSDQGPVFLNSIDSKWSFSFSLNSVDIMIACTSNLFLPSNKESNLSKPCLFHSFKHRSLYFSTVDT